MRRAAPPGAFGFQAEGSREVEPYKPRKRTVSPSETRRKQERKRLALETAVAERHDIRNERNSLARRHRPDAHIAPDELAAKDWTRPLRVEGITLDVDAAYRAKRGEAR